MKTRTSKETFIFSRILESRLEDEQHPFTKLVYLENILSVSIISTLHTCEKYLEIKNPNNKFNLNFDDLDSFSSNSKVPTLGNLNLILKRVTGNSNLFTKVKEFVDYRNKITHNMHSRFKSLEDLDKESSQAISKGYEALGSLNDFRSTLWKDLGID